MTATAATIVNDALKEIHVLAEGDTPSATMADDAFRALNRIMEMLSNDQSFAYTPNELTIALTGQSTFTIGAAGDIVADRPIAIQTATFDRGSITYPVQVVDNQKWDNITYKTAAGANPVGIWYEPTMPTGIVHVWPVCTGGTLRMRVLNLVNSFASLATTLSMPPGYEEALIKTLAVNIAPQYPAGTLSPLTIKAAERAMRLIRKTNNVIPTMSLPGGLPAGGGYSFANFLAGI